MKKLLSMMGILGGALWLCTASAGLRLSSPLTMAGTTASGALGTVRNDGTTNFINCTLLGCPSGSCAKYHFPAPVSMECLASTPAVSLDCTSTNPNLIAVVQAMSPDSYVSFTSDRTGSNGTCVQVAIANGSPFEVPSTYP
jgi:hypothetical protein